MHRVGYRDGHYHTWYPARHRGEDGTKPAIGAHGGRNRKGHQQYRHQHAAQAAQQDQQAKHQDAVTEAHQVLHVLAHRLAQHHPGGGAAPQGNRRLGIGLAHLGQ